MIVSAAVHKALCRYTRDIVCSETNRAGCFMPLKTKASCTPFGARFVHPCFQRILYLPMLSTFRTAFFFDCLSWLLRNYNFVSAVPQIQMATDGFGRHGGWVQGLCFETTFTRVSLFFASIINTIAATSRSRYTVPLAQVFFKPSVYYPP